MNIYQSKKSLILASLIAVSILSTACEKSPHAKNKLLEDNEITIQDETKKNSVKELSKLAHDGVAQAQGRLAQEFYDGIYVKQNEDKALYWASVAHESGDSLGTLILARMAFYGEGMPRDTTKAINLMHEIQDTRIEAKYILGRMYLDTHELAPYGIIRGGQLIEQAADNGFAAAQYDHAKNLMEGIQASNQELDQKMKSSVKVLAVEYMAMAAAQDFGPALREMGVFYLNGYGNIAKDQELAKKYLEQASELGDQIANECLKSYKCEIGK